MAEVFENLHQVHKYILGQGYRCSYKKLKRASEERELPDRRGGGWTARSVDQYARAFLSRAVNASPEYDAPPAAEEISGASERKVNSQADIFEVRAKKERLDLAERLGRMTATATVEAELAARARAFRLGLERFGHEQAEPVAELFGGSRGNAVELARRLGFEDGEEREKAVALIVDFCLQRASRFPRFFAGRVDTFMDAYATGKWWTEEMREAWEAFLEHEEEEIPEVDYAG